MTATAAVTAFFAFPLYLISENTGAEPGHTGGPFPGENTCGKAQCHNTTPDTGPGRVSVTANGAPLDQFRYTPGETVDLIVRIEDPDQERWGFQITARNSDDVCRSEGSLAPAGGDNIRILEGIPVGPCSGPQYATHSFPPKLGDGSQEYAVSWTAPSTDVGPIVFAAAGNAANGDNQRSGDRIYTMQATVEPAVSEPPPPTPSISSGGVLNGGSLLADQGFSPNGFISVFGQNLTQGTSTWDDAFQDGQAPTSLRGTEVLINGKPGFIAFVGDGDDLGREFDQINLVAPDDDDLGPVTLEVVSNGVASAPFTITLERAAPAFFPFDPQGRRYLAAIQNDGSALVGPSDLFGGADLGRPIAPAKPGDIVALFFAGGGPTDPPVPAGTIPGGDVVARTTGTFRVFFGDLEAEVFFSGLSSFVGLYQVVLRVPEAPDGDVEVIGELDGVRTQAGAFLAIQR